MELFPGIRNDNIYPKKVEDIKKNLESMVGIVGNIFKANNRDSIKGRGQAWTRRNNKGKLFEIKRCNAKKMIRNKLFLLGTS